MDDMKKKAKSKNLKKISDEMGKMMRVSIAAKDKSGLLAGLEKAEDMVESGAVEEMSDKEKMLEMLKKKMKK